MLIFMNLIIGIDPSSEKPKIPEMSSQISKLVEQCCVQYPSVQIVRYVFQFVVNVTTFHVLSNLQKPLHLKIIYETMLIPLEEFMNSQPLYVKQSATLEHCCNFLQLLFEFHFIDENDQII